MSYHLLLLPKVHISRNLELEAKAELEPRCSAMGCGHPRWYLTYCAKPHPALSFLFKVASTVWSLSWYHTNFTILFSICMKNIFDILVRIIVNLLITLGITL